MANEYRVTWHGLEAFNTGNPSVRVTFHGIEVFNTGNPQARSSWHGIEVFRSLPPVDTGVLSFRKKALSSFFFEDPAFINPKHKMKYAPPVVSRRRPVLFVIT